MNTDNEITSTDTEDKTGASVKFPPPLVFVIFILLAYSLHYLHPILISNLAALQSIGITVTLLGLLILLLSFLTFKKAQTSIEPWKPTSNIISSGIFAYSRNPIYLAFCIITIGIALILNSLWVLMSIIPSLIIVFFIAIKKEEVYLENKFGQEYLNYKAKVRRWV